RPAVRLEGQGGRRRREGVGGGQADGGGVGRAFGGDGRAQPGRGAGQGVVRIDGELTAAGRRRRPWVRVLRWAAWPHRVQGERRRRFGQLPAHLHRRGGDRGGAVRRLEDARVSDGAPVRRVRPRGRAPRGRRGQPRRGRGAG